MPNRHSSPSAENAVPCLFIDGKPLYESSDIIAWAQENLL